jgi:hypothetical protein
MTQHEYFFIAILIVPGLMLLMILKSQWFEWLSVVFTGYTTLILYVTACCLRCNRMLLEKHFGSGKNMRSSLAIQSAKRPRHQSKTRIAAEKFAVLIDETPVEAVYNFAPWTLFIVTHFEPVIRAT